METDGLVPSIESNRIEKRTAEEEAASASPHHRLQHLAEDLLLRRRHFGAEKVQHGTREITCDVAKKKMLKNTKKEPTSVPLQCSLAKRSRIISASIQ